MGKGYTRHAYAVVPTAISLVGHGGCMLFLDTLRACSHGSHLQLDQVVVEMNQWSRTVVQMPS